MPGSDGEPIPGWDLAAIYPSLGSTSSPRPRPGSPPWPQELIAHLATAPAAIGAAKAEGLGDWLSKALELEDAAGSLYETLSAYAYATFSTATGDAAALAQLNAIEELGLPLQKTEVLFRNALAARRAEVEALLGARDPRIAPFAFHIREELFWQSKQMAPELEELAADLSRSGGNAWGRLQETVTSAPRGAMEADLGERKTLVELRNLAYDPDRAVREKAYRLELQVCEANKIPVAAALNGVKGFTVSLNARRGWDGALEKSIEQARIYAAPPSIRMISAMEESLPSWRRYLGAKARLLGLGQMRLFRSLRAPGGRCLLRRRDGARGALLLPRGPRLHRREILLLRSRDGRFRLAGLRRPLDRRRASARARSAAPTASTSPRRRPAASCAISTAPSTRSPPSPTSSGTPGTPSASGAFPTSILSTR